MSFLRCSSNFFYLVVFCLGVSPNSLVIADDFTTNLNDLGSKSRTKIKKAVINLGKLGDPSALPVLEALKSNRLPVLQDSFFGKREVFTLRYFVIRFSHAILTYSSKGPRRLKTVYRRN